MQKLRGKKTWCVVAVGVACCLSGWWTAAHYAAPTDTPPYGVSFEFDHSSFPGPDLKAFGPDDPITARAYCWKFDTSAPPPEMQPTWNGDHSWTHWLTLIAKDADGLAYRWQRELTNAEYQQEFKTWQGADRGRHFSFDLREWVPKGFQWKPGVYQMKGLASVSNKPLVVQGKPFFFGEVPESFRKPAPVEARLGPSKPLVKLELKANKQKFQPGEIIEFDGFVENVSDQPFMLQTRAPFLEARLIASPGKDVFPKQPPKISLRLSHFSQLRPGEKLHLFRETFVAGRSDPDWAMVMRDEAFATPFAEPNREVWLELSSDGIFPGDRQPDWGIWTGRAESNRLVIEVK